jgi:hypothetical protein
MGARAFTARRILTRLAGQEAPAPGSAEGHEAKSFQALALV